MLVVKSRLKLAAIVFASALVAGGLCAESVAVRYTEGVVRGFLVLRGPDGAVIADGDSIQFARAGRVTNRLVFHFRDGSLQDETAVFTQRERFQLVSDHLIQRGPSFPHAMEVSIDAASGRVTVRHRDDGKEGVIEERMALPADLANGLVSALVKNFPPDTASRTVPMVVATPRPRLVKLVITRAGDERLSGGIAGRLAPLVGKQPRDASVWILGGDAPGFVASESQFYEGGPLWKIELAAPDYQRAR